MKHAPLAVALLAGLFATDLLAAPPLPRGKIRNPAGQVDLYAAAFNKWKGPIKGEFPVFSGDRVRTGPGSSCTVSIFTPSGAEDRIDVMADTILEIPDVPENGPGDTKWIGMSSNTEGMIACTINRKPPSNENEPSPFNVRTPTVVAGVRGTQFDVQYDNRNRRSFLGLKSGLLNGLMYGGLAVGLLAPGESAAVTGLKVFRYASHLKNMQDFLGGNQDRVNEKYNLDFYVAQSALGGCAVDGVNVDASFIMKELPWEGRDWDRPMVITTTKGSTLLHLRETGWFRLDAGSELSCYKLGNAIMGRLRQGKMTFWRSDPNQRPLRHGPRHEVEIFMAKQDGNDLKVMDYTRKGGVTLVTLDMGMGGKYPTVDVLEGDVKVMTIVNQ